MATLALSSASSTTRPNFLISSSQIARICCPTLSFNKPTRRKTCSITCEVTLASSESSVTSSSSSSFNENELTDEEAKAVSKIGSRVSVKGPLKVYHVPKVSEIELTGKEGVIKQYVVIWKGKRVSANLPFKVEFVEKVEGRDNPVKFFAHLREDEFEYLD